MPAGVVSDLEGQLAELTGHAATKLKVRRGRRPSITDAALQDQILKVMANHGKTVPERQAARRQAQPGTRCGSASSSRVTRRVLKRAGVGSEHRSSSCPEALPRSLARAGFAAHAFRVDPGGSSVYNLRVKP